LTINPPPVRERWKHLHGAAPEEAADDTTPRLVIDSTKPPYTMLLSISHSWCSPISAPGCSPISISVCVSVTIAPSVGTYAAWNVEVSNASASTKTSHY